MPILSILIFLPILASLAILFIPEQQVKWIRYFSILICVAELVVSGLVYIQFDKNFVGYQFFEKSDWITLSLGEFGKLSIDYCLGIDGLSLPLILLSSFIFLIAAIASNTIREKQKGYYSIFLLLHGTVAGCFLSLDFFLFFLFFEFMLLPMYFLIGMWGGPRREYAAIKFYLYTLFGSVLILIVMIALYTSAYDPSETAHSFSMNLFQYFLSDHMLPEKEFVHTLRFDHLSDLHNYINGSILHYSNLSELAGLTYRQWAFLLLMIGFAIKLPTFPFHTWLPDAHVEAPTPVSVILASILLKIGAYGMIRIAYPLFPAEAVYFSMCIAGFGVISIIYAAYNALAQNDLKKMIAYSSVSHMGFILLGLSSLSVEGVSGAIYQMVSHGFISGSLFLITGIIYDRTHDRIIQNYRGLAEKMPYYTAIVVITFFASLGLPGFSGFIAEVLVFLGAFKSQVVPVGFAIAATFGLILSAAYYLWTLQRMFFGKFWISEILQGIQPINDLTAIELITCIPLLIFMILLGLFPNLLTDIINIPVGQLLKRF